MAKIINGRVRQKAAPLAEWQNSNLESLDGEQLFVRSDVDDAVIGFKFGAKGKTFSELPYPDLTVRDKATPSMSWSGRQSGVYIPTTNGSYNGINVNLTEGYQVLYWDGSTLQKVVYPTDYTGAVFGGVIDDTYDLSTPPTDPTWYIASAGTYNTTPPTTLTETSILTWNGQSWSHIPFELEIRGEFLVADNIQEVRNMTPEVAQLLVNGTYKGVTVLGYYNPGDTPAAINYYLSDTTDVDDGGSVISVAGIKLEHKFNVIYPEYFGAKGDGVSDDTIPLQRSFAKLNTFKSIFINDDKRFRKTQHINIGSVSNASIMGDGWIHNDDCDGITGFYDTCYGQLNVRLFNSDYTKNRFGLRVSGTKSRFNLKAYTDNLTSQYGTAIRFFDFTDNDITYQIHGNRMGLTDADTNTDIINTLKGKGAQVSYGINNTFTNCYSIYFAVGLDMPLETHPTAGYANEGSMFSNCRFLWSSNNIWINVGTGLEFVNCMVDISRKESLIVNNVYRMTFTNSWISTVAGYAPWNVVVDNSRGVVFNNIMLGAGNANSMQVRNSQRCIFDNIVAKYDTSLPITNNMIIESTNNDCHIGRILGLNLINQSTSTTFISNTKRIYNNLIRDNDLGSGAVPTNTVINAHGSRIATLDGETVNIFEVFDNSSSSTANNFQLGKTSKGLTVRSSGVAGWKTSKLLEVATSTSVSSTGIATSSGYGVVKQGVHVPNGSSIDTLLTSLRNAGIIASS